MKAKLIKVNDYYYLRESYKTGIGGAVCERTLGTTNSQGELGKLSKQNCDELFRVTDVEKLAEEEIPNDGFADTALMQKGFIKGFNKAMELMKDKQFTEEDMRTAMTYGVVQEGTGFEDIHSVDDLFNLILRKVSQPAEIEVEIVMELHPVNHASGLELTGNEFMDFAILENYKPKLDSTGCLILKKI